MAWSVEMHRAERRVFFCCHAEKLRSCARNDRRPSLARSDGAGPQSGASWFKGSNTFAQSVFAGASRSSCLEESSDVQHVTNRGTR